MPVNRRDFVVLAPEAAGRESETFTSATSGDVDGSAPTHRGAWIHEPIAVAHYLEDGSVLITPPPGCTGHMEAWHRHPDLSDPEGRYWQDRSGVEVRLDHQGATCPVHEAT